MQLCFDLEKEVTRTTSVLAKIILPSCRLSEYQLLQTLKHDHPDFFTHLPKPDSLYQQHFWLFFALYRWRTQLKNHQFSLTISALEIQLTITNPSISTLIAPDPLSEFYSNIDNLYLSEDEVESMQKLFWQKYIALDRKVDAIKTLKLQHAKEITKPILKKQFQKLAQKHHPDKGGSEQQFYKIKQAYNDLLCLLQK